MTEYRPDDWTPELEKILQFVRRWRDEQGVEIGSEPPPLSSDSGNGFVLFSALPREPEGTFDGHWWRDVRRDASFQRMIAHRIDHNPLPVLEGGLE